jgi:hypothetical protein
LPGNAEQARPRCQGMSKATRSSSALPGNAAAPYRPRLALAPRCQGTRGRWNAEQEQGNAEQEQARPRCQGTERGRWNAELARVALLRVAREGKGTRSKATRSSSAFTGNGARARQRGARPMGLTIVPIIPIVGISQAIRKIP